MKKNVFLTAFLFSLIMVETDNHSSRAWAQAQKDVEFFPRRSILRLYLDPSSQDQNNPPMRRITPEKVDPIKTPEIVEPIKEPEKTPEIVEPIKEPEKVPEIVEPVKEPEKVPEIVEPIKEPEKVPEIVEPIKEPEKAPEIVEPVKEPEKVPETIKPAKDEKPKKEVPKKIKVPTKRPTIGPGQIKSSTPKSDPPVAKSAFPIIINPGGRNQNPEIVWKQLLTAKELFEWGRGKGLFLYPDSPPVVDNIAGSIPKYGVKIPLKGFESNKYYRVHIDFVKWRNPSIDSFPHRLRIFGDSGNGYRELADIGVKDIPIDDIFFIDLPIDMTTHGKMNLMLRELYAPESGYWAVWDIIITEKDGLPQILPENRQNDDLPIRNYILQ